MDVGPQRRGQPRRSGGAVFLLGAALLVFLAITALWMVTELGRARELREHLLADFDARSNLSRAFSDVQDAESAQRGYVIVGAPAFLERFDQARRDLGVRYRRLESAFANEPAQLARLHELRRLTDLKLREFDQVIVLKRTGRSGEAAAAIADRRGRALMVQIRSQVGLLRDAQTREIEALLAADASRAVQTEQIVVLLFVGLLVGAAATVVLVRRYIHARQHLLAATREEAARERAIFGAAMDGILIIDGEGRIERANPAAQRIFGVGQDALAGKSALALLDETAARELGPLLHAPVGAERVALRRDVGGVRADGTQFPAELSFAPLIPGQDTLLLFVRDISDRREVERLKDEFVSTVSHELRTPLTSIAGSLGLIVGGAAGALPDKAARLVSIAQANSQRLVRLINDVLDLEKLESGKMPFHFSGVDLNEVVSRAVEGLRGYADQLSVELAFEAGEPAPVRGDVDRLMQVVTNLVSNAAKYSPKGQTVTVRTSRDAQTVRLTVTDRGPGVPEAFRDRIFSRFAQADASDARGKSGTGLGLYIAKEIAERHGGRLWFESPAGGGATFHLEMPLLEEGFGMSTSRDRVLLVEDEPAAAALLTAILEHEGLKVDTAGTLAEARVCLRDAGRYGAMVLDLRLPDGDGLDLVKEIRARADTRGVPIVVVSADAARGRDPEVKTLDVVDWMEKPVDPDRLADLVRRAVGPTAPGGALILHVDDDRDIRELVAAALAGCGEVVSAEGVAQARALLAERRPDVVVLDLELRDGSGLDLMADLQEEPGPPIPVVVFSAQDIGDLGSSVAAVLVKSRTSLAGLAGAVRDLVPASSSATSDEGAETSR